MGRKRSNDLDEAIRIAYKLQPSLQMQMYCDLNGVAAFPVKLIFDDEGDHNYFNSKTREIHLGVKFTYSYFRDDPDMPIYHDGYVDEARLLSVLQYMLVHEESHVLYTGGESWDWAARHCTEMAIEAVSNDVLKTRRPFRRTSDYDDALKDLQAANFYLPVNWLGNIFNGMTNSMEDGRIERIAAGKDAKFANQRTIWRHAAWNVTDTYAPADKMSATERMRLMLNGILSLATTGVFPKGFTTAYAGTDVLDELNSYIPEISEAYMASSTRDLAAAEFKLFPKFWPTLYAALKETQKDMVAQKELEDMLSELLTQIAESDYGNDKHAQEDTEHSNNTPLPMSNLVITLPDDVYDKLMAKAKESEDQDGGGVQIRREHPKEEEQKESDDKSGSGGGSDSSAQSGQSGQEGDGSGDGSSQSDGSQTGDSQNGNPQNGSGQSGDQSSDQASQPGSSSGKQDGNGQESSDQSSASSGKSGANQSTDGQQRSSNNSGNDGSAFHGGTEAEGNAQGMTKSKQVLGKDSKTDLDMIQKALQEAAESMTAAAESEISSVNQSNLAGKSLPMKQTAANDVPDTARALHRSDVSELMDGEDFEEIKHANYRRIYDLPTVLSRRGRVLRQAVAKYFRSQITPSVRNMRSGMIDARKLTRLAKNDIRVFQRKGTGKPADIAVYILIDNSGSMYGAKTEAAFSAAAVQEEGFKEFAAMKITAFTTGRGVLHYTVKGWEEQHPWNACWNFLRHMNPGIQCGNEDEYDIRIATKELLARSEKKKILIVLSDGTPGDCDATKDAIADARKKGISVAGIYFEEGMIGSCASQFIDMYQRDYVCCTVDEIDENLSAILHKFALS